MPPLPERVDVRGGVGLGGVRVGQQRQEAQHDLVDPEHGAPPQAVLPVPLGRVQDRHADPPVGVHVGVPERGGDAHLGGHHGEVPGEGQGGGEGEAVVGGVRGTAQGEVPGEEVGLGDVGAGEDAVGGGEGLHQGHVFLQHAVGHGEGSGVERG